MYQWQVLLRDKILISSYAACSHFILLGHVLKVVGYWPNYLKLMLVVMVIMLVQCMYRCRVITSANKAEVM